MFSSPGDESLQRLAIRLLPKFAPRFPLLFSEAAAALQGLSSLNLNNNNTTTASENGISVPIESLEGLKRMLLATTTYTNKDDSTFFPQKLSVSPFTNSASTQIFQPNQHIATAATEALHFALHQQRLHPTISDYQRDLLNSIAKAAFIASPPSILSRIVEIVDPPRGKNSRQQQHQHHVELRPLVLHLIEKHLLVKVGDQEIEIKESLETSSISVSKQEDEALLEVLAAEEEKQEREKAEMPLLLAALNKKDLDNDIYNGRKVVVSALQSLHQHCTSANASSTLLDCLKTVLGTLAPRLPSPTAAAAGGSRKRSTGSLSPKPDAYTNDRRGGRTRALGSSRPPRSSQERSARPSKPDGLPTTTRAAAGGGAAKWSSRGPTPTLEEGELGELDEGELPSASQRQKEQHQAVAAATTTANQKLKSPREHSPGGRGDRERGRERDRGRSSRRKSLSPLDPSYRDSRKDDRLLVDARDGLGSSRDRGRDFNNTSAAGRSNQKVSGRGMPPLEYAGKALWVGQLPVGHMAIREVVDAFSRYGKLASHKIIERSSCAFFNYVDLDCAIEAREQLDGARVAGSTLVVEFKGEKKYWNSREGRERDSQREYPPPGRDDRDHRDRGGEYRRSQSPRADLPPPPSRRGGRDRTRSRSPPGGGGGARPTVVRPAVVNPLWQGSLGKSRQPQADVACIYQSLSSPGWAAAEPAGWPPLLDVQNRISTAYVLNTLLPSLPPAERAVLRVVPAPGRESTETARLHAFSSYLQGKQRTGLVELGPGPQPGGPRQRVLYLIPASEEACRAIGHGQQISPTSGEFMFAVVAPKHDESGPMQ